MKKIIIILRSLYYKIFYGIETMGFAGSPLPEYGKGKNVSVFKKGGYIDIIKHRTLSKEVPCGTIRLVPYQPNHGVMVEYINERGNILSRVVCSYDEFLRMGFKISKQKTK